MKLQPRKVQYSSRQGLTIEWRRPDEITISSEDLVMLLLCLKGALTQTEMDQQFKPEEQEVIQRYFLASEKKHGQLMDRYAEKASLKKLKAEFRHTLDWWKACYEQGIQQVMAQVWGWKLSARETLPVLDRMITDAVAGDIYRDISRIKYLIASYMSMGEPDEREPLPETISQVEARFGPLDWVQLKAEGQALYESYQAFKRS